jgi:hypothetical protein
VPGAYGPLKSLVTILIALATMVAPNAFAIDPDSTFEGTISTTLTRSGTEPVHFLFTRKNNEVRIENTTNKLEPINILDLGAKKLTVIFPYNTTFVQVDQTTTTAPMGGPSTPAGFPSPPVGIGPKGGEAMRGVGPQFSPPPGFPSPPPMPQMPNNSGAGPGVMPAMPMMPPMPGISGTPELKKTDKTKTIQGFECTLYTISDRGQTFEIWATDDSAFYPFRLLQRDYMRRHFGPQMVEEQWPELLQKKSLFPLEATLRMEPNGQERLSFKVDKIEKKPIGDWAALFSPPKDFSEIQVPQF